MYKSRTWAYEKARLANQSDSKKASIRAKRRARIKKHTELLNRLKSVPCKDCKRVFPTICMDFDHLPEFTKKNNVAYLISYSLEVLMTEVAKCEVVCSNCHRIRTESRGWPMKAENRRKAVAI